MLISKRWHLLIWEELGGVGAGVRINLGGNSKVLL